MINHGHNYRKLKSLNFLVKHLCFHLDEVLMHSQELFIEHRDATSQEKQKPNS
jgi:hypothetical protein